MGMISVAEREVANLKSEIARLKAENTSLKKELGFQQARFQNLEDVSLTLAERQVLLKSKLPAN